MTWDAQTPDARLLEAWREGDKTAADVLIGRHGPRLYNFFASKVADGADELCQRTLADCVEGRAPLGPDGARSSVRGLVFTAARRRLLEHFREHGDSQLDPGERSVADLNPGASEVIVARDQQRQLLLVLRQLPVDDQVALELSYWERMSVEEIAGVVDAPESEVEARLADARTRLRGLLEQDRELTGRTVDSRLTEDERGRG